jgi:hypothetical protein
MPDLIILASDTIAFFSVGQYALFRPYPSSKKYPAQIISRDKRKATLAWHPENAYTPGDEPMSPTFSRWARDCTEALDDAVLNSVPKATVSFRSP